MLQLEPRVPVVVPLQVFLLDGHLSWKTQAEEPSHEGPTCPPGCPASSVSTLSVSRLRPKPGMKHWETDSVVGHRGRVLSRKCHVHPDTPRHCHGVHSLGLGGLLLPCHPDCGSGHLGEI